MTDTQNDTSELDAQLLKWAEEFDLLKHFPDCDDSCNDRFLESKMMEALTTLIAQREQAAELRVRKEERSKARQLYAKRNPQYTRQWIADYLGISRPTLNKWLQDPELFTLGAVRRLATLQATKPEKEKDE